MDGKILAVRTAVALCAAAWAWAAPAAAGRAGRGDGIRWRQEAELVGQGQGKAQLFGNAVALSGDLVAAAEPWAGSESAVHLFRRHGSAWRREARLAQDAAVVARTFGASLALSGDTLAIGAPGEEAGVVHVYQRRNAGGWRLQARLASPLAPGGWSFGQALALSGDTLVVGAPFHERAGAAWVYVRHRGLWALTARLLGHDTAPDDEFGAAVATDGVTIAVGAPTHAGAPDEPNPAYRGAVYVFTGGGLRWQEEVELGTASTIGPHLQGSTVAVSGDLVVAGSRFPAGGAHGYRRTSAGWVEDGNYLEAEHLESWGLGDAVAVSGDRVAVGCPFAYARQQVFVGEVFLLRRDPAGTWTSAVLLDADDPAPEYEMYGHALALDGDTLAVAAPRDGENGPDSGAVYVYRLR